MFTTLYHLFFMSGVIKQHFAYHVLKRYITCDVNTSNITHPCFRKLFLIESDLPVSQTPNLSPTLTNIQMLVIGSYAVNIILHKLRHS